MKYAFRVYRLRLEPDTDIRHIVAVDVEGHEWTADTTEDWEAGRVRPFENLDKWELDPQGHKYPWFSRLADSFQSTPPNRVG